MSLNGKYAVGIVLTFVLLVVSMLYSIPLINFFFNFKTLNAELFFYNRLSLWLVLILVMFYNFFIENRSFFVWEDKNYSFKFYISAIISLYLISVVGGGILNAIILTLTEEKMSSRLIELSFIFKNNYLLILFTCLTAAVIEELLMRAYIQPRIEKIYNSPISGIIVSALLFGILHSTYGTVSQVIIPFFIGIIFAMFYKLYSNIKILIITHFLFDFVSLMLMNLIDFKEISLF